MMQIMKDFGIDGVSTTSAPSIDGVTKNNGSALDQFIRTNIQQKQVPQMSPENFVYWLQGFFEIGGGKELTPEQVQMIKDHLHYVFEHKKAVPLQGGTPGVLSPWTTVTC